MKFGRNLPRNQVPEWASSYINYKALKKLIKTALEGTRIEQTPDTAGFFFTLDRNLEDVDRFYNRKYYDAARRLKLLQDQYGKSWEDSSALDRDEMEDLVGALLELRGSLRKLQWYGEVNRRGFVKVTKKLDKKIPEHNQRRYVETKVDLKPFAAQTDLLLELIKTTNDWLSKLGDIKGGDDDSSTSSSQSLPRVSAKAILNLPQGVLDTVEQAIRKDDTSTLVGVLKESSLGNEGRNDPLYQQLLLNLLQRSISCRARMCITKLLSSISSLVEIDDINQRNCLHRFVISLSRTRQSEQDGKDEISEAILEKGNYITPAAPPTLSVPSRMIKELDGVSKLGKDNRSILLLTEILDQLSEEQRLGLKARDSSGRMPLHYAAQYGFVSVVELVLSRMQTWGQLETPQGLAAPFWLDAEGWSPLHLSVTGGHLKTTKALLDVQGRGKEQDQGNFNPYHADKCGEVLAIATKSNYTSIVKVLVDAGFDLDYQDEHGESALHVAARFGHSECARLLLDGTSMQSASTESTESTYGWTPLFIAAVDGHLNIVKALIQAKANLLRTDYSGWTAKEHAALRGHMDIARILEGCSTVADPGNSPRALSPPSSTSLLDRKSKTPSNGSLRILEPVKTFGHRYLIDDTMVLVSLGSMDLRKEVQAVSLDRIPLAEAHMTQLDTALSLVVSASGASGESSVVDLPIQENISTEPFTFMTKDAAKVKLLFDIVPTYAGTKDRVVGRGVALLSSIKPSIGSNRITLQGDVAVPIIAAHNLEVIGQVNFNFLVITPFKHPNLSVTENHTYWKSMTSPMVIGHRGLGKNLASRTSLQLGENTIQSFIAAANLGASYVEFDVQLTKDHVPVIYHDFLVSETGIDAPVHTLTLEQFLHVSDVRTPRSSRAGSPDLVTEASVKNQRSNEARKHRSSSVGTAHKEAIDMSERMKHTRDFKKKGFKGNSRGNSIQAPFTTLEEMLTKLPETIGFNIEMKYAMLHESEEQEMDTYAVELNSFVNSVLTKVYDLGKKRNIIFSSFNPDICLLLSFKQPNLPILFLTDAGTSHVGDVRASSLQEAIRFASRWNLLGVVSTAEPLVLCPRLVKVVKESGLICVSYGTLNNDPEKVKLQVQEGIDAVIVDSVLAIRKGLTGPETSMAPISEKAVDTDSSAEGEQSDR